MLTVRPASAADLPAVAAIEEQSFPSPWPPDGYKYELKRQEGIFLVAEEGDTVGPVSPVVGYVSAYWVLDEAHIMKLAVRPDCRRRGIASLLLHRLIDQARGFGVRIVWLEVRQHNAAGQGFYSAHGFLPAGVRRRYYTDTREDAVVMVRELEP